MIENKFFNNSSCNSEGKPKFIPPQKRQLLENPNTNNVPISSKSIQEKLPDKKIEKLPENKIEKLVEIKIEKLQENKIEKHITEIKIQEIPSVKQKTLFQR